MEKSKPTPSFPYRLEGTSLVPGLGVLMGRLDSKKNNIGNLEK